MMMLILQSPTDKRHPFRALSQLTDVEIMGIVRVASIGLERVLNEAVDQLRRAFQAFDEQVAKSSELQSVASKFEHQLPEMKCGDINGFHGGLENRIGTAKNSCAHYTEIGFSLQKVEIQPNARMAGTPNLEFMQGMRAEHCIRLGSTFQFQTPNYSITR